MVSRGWGEEEIMTMEGQTRREFFLGDRTLLHPDDSGGYMNLYNIY